MPEARSTVQVMEVASVCEKVLSYSYQIKIFVSMRLEKAAGGSVDY